jgi:hypothetical protein
MLLTFGCLATLEYSYGRSGSFGLRVYQQQRASQPGTRYPGGADININLDVSLVSTVLLAKRSVTKTRKSQSDGGTKYLVNGFSFHNSVVLYCGKS